MTALVTSPLLLLVLLCGFSHLTKAQGRTDAIAKKPVSLIPVFKDPNVCCHLKELNKEQYKKCCTEENTCDKVCPLEFPHGKGCLVNDRWYPAGDTITTNKNKCFYEKCCVGPDCPYPYVKNIHASKDCECCEYDGFLFTNNQTIKSASVTSSRNNCQECWEGKWLPIPNTEEACPAGTHEYNGYCLNLVNVWVPWKKAYKICKSMDGLDKWWKNDTNAAIAMGKKIASCSWGLWITGLKPDVCHRLCPGIGIGQSNLYKVSCTSRLRPLCALKKVPCKRTNCVIGKLKYKNGQTIEKIDDCMKITCQAGYPTVVIDKTCCHVELANEIHLVSSGTVSRYGREKCVCDKGKVKCCVDCDEIKEASEVQG